jgi:hypothetical protein
MKGVKRFSSNRERIFQTHDTPPSAPRTEQSGEWVDLYELLQVSPQTSTRDLDEAIIERGADVVYFTFSRAGKPAHVTELEKHLRELRPILLDPPVRRRYDQQLQLHRAKDPRAMRYDDFLQTLDLREQVGGCMSTLVFFLASPLAFLVLEKIIKA